MNNFDAEKFNQVVDYIINNPEMGQQRTITEVVRMGLDKLVQINTENNDEVILYIGCIMTILEELYGREISARIMHSAGLVYKELKNEGDSK